MASLFGLSAADLQLKVQPRNDEQTFEIGVDGDLTEGEALGIIAVAEDRVLSRLPARYRQLCRYVDGEVLTGNAVGGETAFKTGLAPVSGLLLWKNYPGGRMWNGRDVGLAMATSLFSVDETTGEIELVEGLKAGDRLWAEYAHSAGNRLLMLRDAALTLAAVEVSRRFAFFQDGETGVFSDWEDSTMQDLTRLKGVDELDRLRLVRETDPEGFYSYIENMEMS